MESDVIKALDEARPGLLGAQIDRGLAYFLTKKSVKKVKFKVDGKCIIISGKRFTFSS